MAITIDNIQVTKSLTPPDVSKLTTNSLEGTGVFDTLMRVTKLHLQEEYDAERITQDEYATVYLGTLTSVLQQSIQFLLSHQQEEKTIADIGLVRQKTVTELVQTDDDIPVGLGFNGGVTVQGLVKDQKDLNAQAILEAQQNVLTAEKNVELTEQKIVTELAQTDTDIPTGLGHNNSNVIEGLIRSQREKVDAEKVFTEQKSMSEVAQVNDTLPTGIGINTSTTITGLIKAQKDKTTSEVQLLDQRAVTELAQTADTIPLGTGINTATTVDGITGKQSILLTAQSDGFTRDAEQKAAKMLIDTWSVRRTTDEATVADNINKLDDASIGAVVTKLKNGINIV